VFTIERILRDLAQTKKLGYAAVDNRYHPRVYGLAKPVLDGRRRPMATIGITTLDGEPLADAQVQSVIVCLTHEAAVIAKEYEGRREAVSERWIYAGQPQWEKDQGPAADPQGRLPVDPQGRLPVRKRGAKIR
jgi:hypothetical protein